MSHLVLLPGPEPSVFSWQDAGRALDAQPPWSIDASLSDLLAPECEAASQFARRVTEPSDEERADP